MSVNESPSGIHMTGSSDGKGVEALAMPTARATAADAVEPETSPVSSEAGVPIAALGSFGHHPDPAIDFCIEVEEIESLVEGFRLGHTGDGQEAEHAALPDRIERALRFRACVDQNCIDAKFSLRAIAIAFGFNLRTEQRYEGQPIPRQVVSDDTVRDQLPPSKPYPVHFVTAREQRQ